MRTDDATADQGTELITTAEVARSLRVNTRTVYHYIRYRGFPTPTRSGRVLLHDPDQISEWRRSHPARKH